MYPSWDENGFQLGKGIISFRDEGLGNLRIRTRDVWYGVLGYIWRTERDGMEVEAWDGRWEMDVCVCVIVEVERAGDGDVHTIEYGRRMGW